MSTSLTLLPATPRPAMTRALAAAVEAIEKPHPDIPMRHAYPVEVIEEAKSLVSVLRADCQPVDAERLAIWLAPIMAALPNPIAPDAIKPWLGAVNIAVSDMEGCLFNVETQRSALRTWRFWPSAADVYAVLVGPQTQLRERVWALAMIAESDPER